MSEIIYPSVFFEKVYLKGDSIVEKSTYIKDYADYYVDYEEAKKQGNTLAYSVQCYFPVEVGSDGGLFFGITNISAGVIGTEFIFTKGHFHAKQQCAEYYWGLEGEGLLILMNKDRSFTVEKVQANSLHYIRGDQAHRLINVGKSTLKVGACWGSDAGYDYETLKQSGFSCRVFQKNNSISIEKNR
ncbi:MAG: glucose-6-phosphate isomerase family protein [Chitinophagaceae bacterium]